MTDIVCGNCKHWKHQVGYRWGSCTVVLPAWVQEAEFYVETIDRNDKMAARCDVFTTTEDKP